MFFGRLVLVEKGRICFETAHAVNHPQQLHTLRLTHPKCTVSYWADFDDWDWQAAGRNMRANISYDIFPEK